MFQDQLKRTKATLHSFWAIGSAVEDIKDTIGKTTTNITGKHCSGIL